MRAAAFMLNLSVFGMVALACGSCRGASPDEQRGLLQSSEAQSIEDSGKRISGDYVVKGIEDDYGNKDLQGQPLTTFRLEESGEFKIERESGGVILNIEEGTYVVSLQDELVLYVEKVDGGLLAEARTKRYGIIERTADRIRLRSSPSITLVLEKK
jgi:hypothetical protein